MDNIFAVNLKNLRIEKGLNQTELAEKLFINKSMISSYEKGIFIIIMM
jgi:transcriptional regulator with XRE-family HTH domain